MKTLGAVCAALCIFSANTVSAAIKVSFYSKEAKVYFSFLAPDYIYGPTEQLVDLTAMPKFEGPSGTSFYLYSTGISRIDTYAPAGWFEQWYFPQNPFTSDGIHGPMPTVGPTDDARIEIHQVSGVPEPATWAMMVAGVGAVGGSLRYRRRLKAVAYRKLPNRA